MTAHPAPVWRVELPDEAATQALARDVASFVGADDLVTLSGDLGAGKTTFARALIRCLADDPELETPSPTFTLMQVYETPDFPIVHADLYRVKDPSELAELGWDEAADGALVLVEWAERAGSALTGDRLDIALFTDTKRGPDYRRAEITGHGALAQRLWRTRGAQNVLERAGWDEAERQHMQGDASTRAYELLVKPDGAKGDPDDLAAASGRTLGPQRQALQRHRPSRRKHPPLRRGGRSIARAKPVGAGDFRRRSPDGLRGARIFRSGGDRQRRGADPGTLRGRRRRCWPTCMRATCRKTCRSTAGPIASRPMTSKPC